MSLVKKSVKILIPILLIVTAVFIGKTIIKEAQKGKFGTVVMGRSGTNNSFFFGSVSRSVLEKGSAFATWLVP